MANVCVNVVPDASVLLSNEPSSAVTVCPVLSLLVHVTVVPTGTVMDPGWKLRFAIVTAFPLAADVAAGGALAAGEAVALEPPPHAASVRMAASEGAAEGCRAIAGDEVAFIAEEGGRAEVTRIVYVVSRCWSRKEEKHGGSRRRRRRCNDATRARDIDQGSLAAMRLVDVERVWVERLRAVAVARSQCEGSGQVDTLRRLTDTSGSQPSHEPFITVIARPAVAAELTAGVACGPFADAPGIGHSVDDIVAAITTRPGVESTSAPVTIGGYDGQVLDLRVADVVDERLPRTGRAERGGSRSSCKRVRRTGPRRASTRTIRFG